MAHGSTYFATSASAARPNSGVGRVEGRERERMCGSPATAPRRFPSAARQATEPTVEGTPMAEEVRAEMVANVWKVLVAEGDTVADGDTLVILESMKMEIPVVAEVDGIVAVVGVTEGQVVQEGDLIAEIS
jgi:biotin carboxyl carrier protein